MEKKIFKIVGMISNGRGDYHRNELYVRSTSEHAAKRRLKKIYGTFIDFSNESVEVFTEEECVDDRIFSASDMTYFAYKMIKKFCGNAFAESIMDNLKQAVADEKGDDTFETYKKNHMKKLLQWLFGNNSKTITNHKDPGFKEKYCYHRYDEHTIAARRLLRGFYQKDNYENQSYFWYFREVFATVTDNVLTIHIFTDRPGLFIGKGGRHIDAFEEYVINSHYFHIKEFNELKINLQETDYWPSSYETIDAMFDNDQYDWEYDDDDMNISKY